MKKQNILGKLFSLKKNSLFCDSVFEKEIKEDLVVLVRGDTAGKDNKEIIADFLLLRANIYANRLIFATGLELVQLQAKIKELLNLVEYINNAKQNIENDEEKEINIEVNKQDINWLSKVFGAVKKNKQIKKKVYKVEDYMQSIDFNGNLDLT